MEPGGQPDEHDVRPKSSTEGALREGNGNGSDDDDESTDVVRRPNAAVGHPFNGRDLPMCCRWRPLTFPRATHF